MSRQVEPVDLGHLDRYTGGDRALDAEILRLFDRQCQEMLAQMEGFTAGSCDGKRWRQIAHTLKGAARGIGAFALADAAAAAEEALPSDRASTLAALERIKGTSAAVQLFIEEFLKGGE